MQLLRDKERCRCLGRLVCLGGMRLSVMRSFIACDRAGMTTRQLSERFNVSVRTVSRWRTRLHINHVEPAVRHPEEDREQALALIREGASFSEAARTVGAHQTTVRAWFPDVPAWSHQQCVEHAVLVRTFKDVA